METNNISMTCQAKLFWFIEVKYNPIGQLTYRHSQFRDHGSICLIICRLVNQTNRICLNILLRLRVLHHLGLVKCYGLLNCREKMCLCMAIGILVPIVVLTLLIVKLFWPFLTHWAIKFSKRYCCRKLAFICLNFSDMVIVTKFSCSWCGDVILIFTKMQFQSRAYVCPRTLAPWVAMVLD